jgi:hypothetical protein
MGFAAMLMAGGAVFGDRPLESRRTIEVETIGSVHKCTFPVVDANAPPGCEAEAAGYAAALIVLQAARDNADEAYLEWYRCLNGGKDPVTPTPTPTPAPDPNPNPPPSGPGTQSTVSLISR